MIKIRYGVFETNSSSVHSLCIAQNDEIKKLKNEELLICTKWDNRDTYVSYDEAVAMLIKEFDGPFCEDKTKELAIIKSGDRERIYDLMEKYDVAQPLTRYLEDEYLEAYKETFTTKHGDKVMVFGRYGHN